MSFIIDFATSLTVPANQTVPIYIYSDTTELDTTGDAITLWLDDSTAGNLDFGIDSLSNSYQRANIIWRGDIFAGSLVNPS